MQVLWTCTDNSSIANLEGLLTAGAKQVSHHASLAELHFKMTHSVPSSAPDKTWCRDTQESAPSLSKWRPAAAASLAKGSTF